MSKVLAEDEIEHAIAALQAVRLVRDYYGSGVESAKRVEEIAQMLAARDSKMGQFGGLRATIGDAICKAYLNQPLQPT
jgi:hypothetical protein